MGVESIGDTRSVIRATTVHSRGSASNEPVPAVKSIASSPVSSVPVMVKI